MLKIWSMVRPDGYPRRTLRLTCVSGDVEAEATAGGECARGGSEEEEGHRRAAARAERYAAFLPSTFCPAFCLETAL